MTTYTYDQAGNLALVHVPGSVRTSYSWDDENRNTKPIIPGGAITTMAYRHDGLRVRKQTAAGTTKFIYDGQDYLLETDASDTVNRVLTSEPMAYGNLVSQRVKSGAVWTPYYHHFDALGSTRQMTGSAGTTVNSYGYTAWGEAVAGLTSESIANYFRWVGMLGYFFDDEADTYYVRARHYDPVTGRWLAQDPLWRRRRHRAASLVESSILGINVGARHKEVPYEYANGPSPFPEFEDFPIPAQENLQESAVHQAVAISAFRESAPVASSPDRWVDLAGFNRRRCFHRIPANPAKKATASVGLLRRLPFLRAASALAKASLAFSAARPHTLPGWIPAKMIWRSAHISVYVSRFPPTIRP